MKAVLAGTAFFIVILAISAVLELAAVPCEERRQPGWLCPSDTSEFSGRVH
jgi:hypothetical protein